MQFLIASRVRSIVIFATICVVLPKIYAQRGATNTPNSGTYTVEGTVISSVTNQPVARALVTIQSASTSNAALSGSDGTFRIRNVSAGQAWMQVRKPGFSGPEGSAQFRVESDTTGLVVRLSPNTILSGHVEDTDHEPIVNALVVALSNVIRDGRRRPEPSGEAHTDGDGDFRIAGLGPGEYLVLVAPENDVGSVYSSADDKRDWGFGETFYPGVDTIAGAVPIELAPGRPVSVGMQLRPRPIHHVAGTIVGNTASQPATVYLKRHAVPGMFKYATSSLSDGKFHFTNVSEDTYVVQATTAEGHYGMIGGPMAEQTHPLIATQELTVSGDISNLPVAVSPPVSIPLHVRVDRAHNNPATQDWYFQVTLEPESWVNEEAAASAVAGSDEPSVIDAVAPGTYSLRFSGTPGLRVQSARFGDIDLLQDKLVVTTSAPSGGLEVVLQDDVGALEIAVPTDVDCFAVLVPLSTPALPPSVDPLAKKPGRTGVIALSGLAPGDYDVYLFERSINIAYAEPGVIAAYASKATHVSVPPDGKVTIKPQVIRANR